MLFEGESSRIVLRRIGLYRDSFLADLRFIALIESSFHPTWRGFEKLRLRLKYIVLCFDLCEHGV